MAFIISNQHKVSVNPPVSKTLENHLACDNFNLICVIICDKCKAEDNGEAGEGKTNLRDRVRVYHQHIWQLQYQQLKVEGHLRVCGNREFQIFPLLQMRSQDTN